MGFEEAGLVIWVILKDCVSSHIQAISPNGFDFDFKAVLKVLVRRYDESTTTVVLGIIFASSDPRA